MRNSPPAARLPVRPASSPLDADHEADSRGATAVAPRSPYLPAPANREELNSCPDFDAIDRSRSHCQELAIANNMAPSADSDPPPRRTSERVALLIDTENVGAAHKDEMAECARRHGKLVHCIGFGRRMDDAWKAEGSFPDLEWGEGTVESTGRNAADIDLTAAAVDLLHTEPIDIFCIASGDRDFTGLVRRLQNRGKKVVGDRSTASEREDVPQRMRRVRGHRSEGRPSHRAVQRDR